MAQHDFAGADALGGNAGVGLQADAKIGSSAAGASAADDLFAAAQGDGGAGGSGEVPGAFGDSADGGFKVEFGGMEIFFGQVDGMKARRWMCGIGDAETSSGEGTVRNRSRTSLSSSESVMRCAVC